LDFEKESLWVVGHNGANITEELVLHEED